MDNKGSAYSEAQERALEDYILEWHKEMLPFFKLFWKHERLRGSHIDSAYGLVDRVCTAMQEAGQWELVKIRRDIKLGAVSIKSAIKQEECV